MKIYLEIELEVEYDADPGEAAYTTGLPENCYPGSAATLDLTSVKYNGKELELTEKDMEKAKEWVWDELEEEADCDI